jgi:hypothetical protein|tara:strand:- start:423 stop:1055 length:633 start_codon:yes stop_codon:yes gene_type:complete
MADGIDGLQIATRTIPANRVVADSLTASELGPNAAGTSEIKDLAVTPAKLSQAYQVALGTLSKNASVFRDVTGDTPTTPVEVNDEDAANFPNAVTTAIRVAFDIPDDYLTTGSLEVYLRISASTSEAADFRVQSDFRINGGALQGTTDATVTPNATLTVQNLVGPILTISTGTLTNGDGIALLIRRLGGDVADDHTGTMRLFRVVLKYTV